MRYTGPVCRLCRREGEKLYLKGDKCYTDKCPVQRRAYAPGQHGQARKKLSEYGLQLRMKQRLRRIYGVSERQMENYYRDASRKRGITGEILLQALEMRLDNIVFRLGIGASRPQARQLVMHGHISVNGHKVDIPSYEVKAGDVVTVRESSRNLDLVKMNVEAASERALPEWLEFDPEKLEGRVKAVPTRAQIDVPVEEHLVVEYYSR
ncbi:MAG TPA: 30S ribosomal protein S4 [Limnochordia bacterium]|jgi:small subunit ribosomal protein S4|nr:30S ribosomal protein S4 [Limnochordia bacterium]HQD70909.1 30S ribosomal protein S4 [Limnochordia bacterium]HXK97138.1 30S ribosomal protein S4 [Limnochordia bacterium]